MTRPSEVSLPKTPLCDALKALQGIDQPRPDVSQLCRELSVRAIIECEFRHSPGAWSETSYETLEDAYRYYDMNAPNDKYSNILNARISLRIPLPMRLPRAYRYDAGDLERLVDSTPGYSMNEVTWEMLPWLIDIGVATPISLDRELESGDLFYPPCYGFNGIRQMLVVGSISARNYHTVLRGPPVRVLSLRCLFDKRNYDRLTWYYDEWMQAEHQKQHRNNEKQAKMG